MSHDFPFYILDVFAESRYTGNQLAVFCGQTSDDDMQLIAREMHFSETTFITSDIPRDGGYDVRIFTPGAELPFAGHPTLGTAYIIRREIIRQPVEQVVLNLKVGQIPVTFADDGVLWMKQKPPSFGHRYNPLAVADVLGLRPRDFDERFPMQEVSTGVTFVIVPLKSRDAIKRARLDSEKFKGMLEGVRGLHPEGLAMFCAEPYHAENQLNVRVMFPADRLGLDEDAATGSANGCLAAYLVRHRYFGNDSVDVRVEQGYEIQRPSLLLLQASQTGDQIDVNVGGRVVLVAKGELTE